MEEASTSDRDHGTAYMPVQQPMREPRGSNRPTL